MAELIFAEQTLEFIKNSQDDIYCAQTDVVLTAGEKYTVIWDGENWECTADNVTVSSVPAVGLGNKSIEGIGEDTGEPFLLGYSADYALALFETLETAETHTVSIYKGVLEEPTPGANIVLYDRNGQPVTYKGIETVSFNTDVDGEIATYTHGTATDEVSVALDLSAGDQTVTPAEATFTKKVVIEKPDNLLPENIRKGETVAGIPGELIGETMSKEVELNFADGDQTVEPDPDTLLSAVIIKKPDNLLPENIRKGETVAGIPGTMSAGGAEPVLPSDINFYDYDGTIVAAWTLEELAAATALPANPKHDGLTAQGWNWTLEELKATNRAMNVGQMYITDDGKTRLYIRITTTGRMTIPLYFKQTLDYGVTIDWGDGSTTETLAGTETVVNTSHTYESTGDYVISLAPADDCTLTLGDGSGTYGVMGGKSSEKVDRAYQIMLRKVEIGRNVTTLGRMSFQYYYRISSITIPNSVTDMGYACFRDCYSLSYITIPNSVTSVGENNFYYCVAFAAVSIPNSVTSIGKSAFYYCYALASVTFPDGVQSFENYAVYNCLGLTDITIPASVTAIKDSAFAYNIGLAEIHLKPTTPPTLASIGAFSYRGPGCVFYVPKGCLSAYKAATNWSSFSSSMQEEAE